MCLNITKMCSESFLPGHSQQIELKKQLAYFVPPKGKGHKKGLTFPASWLSFLPPRLFLQAGGWGKQEGMSGADLWTLPPYHSLWKHWPKTQSRTDRTAHANGNPAGKALVSTNPASLLSTKSDKRCIINRSPGFSFVQYEMLPNRNRKQPSAPSRFQMEQIKPFLPGCGTEAARCLHSPRSTFWRLGSPDENKRAAFKRHGSTTKQRFAELIQQQLLRRGNENATNKQATGTKHNSRLSNALRCSRRRHASS